MFQDVGMVEPVFAETLVNVIGNSLEKVVKNLGIENSSEQLQLSLNNLFSG